MFMHVDPSNGIAIYDQIVRQMKFAIASEALKPGNLVPSVREMARDLTVNPNTVARAYRELQADNVLQPLRGTGSGSHLGGPRKCLEDRAALIRRDCAACSKKRGKRPRPRTTSAVWPKRSLPGSIPKRTSHDHGLFAQPRDQAIQRASSRWTMFRLSSEPGVVVALLGENGAGKTTAIRILLGLLETDRARRLCWARQPPARSRNPPPRRLRPRSAGTLRLDDGRRRRAGSSRAFIRSAFRGTTTTWSNISSCRPTARSRISRRACGPRSRFRWRWHTSPSC